MPADSLLWSELGWLFVLPFLVLLPLYLRAGNQQKFRRNTILKLLLSGLCCLCAWLGWLLVSGAAQPSRWLIGLALAAGIVGDYYLQYIRHDIRKFVTGIVWFGLTQLLLTAWLLWQYGPSWWGLLITALIVAAVQLVIYQQKWQMGAARWPLTIYMTLISFMMSQAVLALVRHQPPTLGMWLLAGGAVLFVLSDLLLGSSNYNSRLQKLHNPSLICYFLAILLIALSNWY